MKFSASMGVVSENDDDEEEEEDDEDVEAETEMFGILPAFDPAPDDEEDKLPFAIPLTPTGGPGIP